jgi:DNA-binding NarL/FixJ family response regulator
MGMLHEFHLLTIKLHSCRVTGFLSEEWKRMQASQPKHKPARIIVIEDDAAARKMLVTALEVDADYKVVAEFSEGRTAIASVKEIKPDIMLIDLGLPDISGIEIIRDIGAIQPKCDMLVITTFGDDHSVFYALEAGARGYLLKGVTSEELRRDIRLLRDGGSPLSPSIARKVLDRLNVNKSKRSDSPKKEARLTPREIEILQLISQGHSYDETAAHCKITNATVHAHLKSIYRKLAVHLNTEAIYEGRRLKIIQ